MTVWRWFILLAGLLCASSLGAQQVKRTGPYAHPCPEAVADPGREWARTLPAEMGLDAASLKALDADIRSGKYGYVDGFAVVRCGRLVYEAAYERDYGRIYAEHAKTPGPLNHGGAYNYFDPDWHPFHKGSDLHSMQSITKSVTALIIGVARARGEFPGLDTPVLRFFDEAKVANVDERKRKMTIRHLLTMTAGMDWNEDLPYNHPENTCMLMEATQDWVRFAIDRPMAAEPGSAFAYNSGATQLLSHIFKQATGEDIQEYAAKHFFGPLDIERFYWKRTPTGLTDTEGGLFLRQQDLARVGHLLLRDGRWAGRQMVEPGWVRDSVAPAMDTGRGGIHYGFKWWLYPQPQESGGFAWGGSGFGGQRLLVLPDAGLVIVLTGWHILDTPPLGALAAIDRVLGRGGKQGP